jgi:hypothetical protein
LMSMLITSRAGVLPMKRGEQTDQTEDTSAYPWEGWLGTLASRVRESEEK